MSFEVDRYSSAWAHIALCADLTWATEPPDEFIVANQRLWAQHCRVSQVLQDSAIESPHSSPNKNKCESTDKIPTSSQTKENGSCSGRRSVKEVIPESRLAQYGNFYYDDVREKCYTSPNEKSNGRGYNGQGCDNSDLTECWMLPEVEYWFRKLLDESADRSALPRRRRQYRVLADDDSERCDPPGAHAVTGEEAALAARVSSVRALWGARARAPSPPAPTRKMRPRRRQPRRVAHLPPPLAYCLEGAAPLVCDPGCKFQFEAPPRTPAAAEHPRLPGRLATGARAAMPRCAPYRGTNVSRYAPTSQRPARCPDRRCLWWPRDHPSPRLDHKPRPPQPQQKDAPEPKHEPTPPNEDNAIKTDEDKPKDAEEVQAETKGKEAETKESPEKVVSDGQVPSTSAGVDAGLNKKRLYSTVLSMSAPPPISLSQVGCVRLSQKLVPSGVLKLNPKIVLPSARMRPPNVDNKFEELEKEALEQYKASDESIDTKFKELEKQAVEQYSNSNSNTSCGSGSGNSAEKRAPTPAADSEPAKTTPPPKFPKDKSVDSVVIYSQTYPDPIAPKAQTTSVTDLKNFHTPPRGGKKEPVHRPCKSTRCFKGDTQRAASDTDNDARESTCKGGHKGSARWSHGPPKKRHLALCVSDFSSDEELDGAAAIKDAGPRMKTRGGKAKMSAHGGGDLQPIVRKT